MQAASFLRHILPEVAGCPSITAQTALVRAAQVLCEDALVWDEVQDPIALSDGVNQIELEAPSGAQICNVKQVFAGNQPLMPLDQAELTRRMPDWQTAQASLPSCYNGARDWGSLWIYPIPLGASAQLVVHACYRPKLDAQTLPDFLPDNFFDALVTGAKARLLKMRNQQWTDLALAGIYQTEFEQLVASARIQVDHGKFQGDLVVAPRRFGR